jgi:hypothetical protein
MRNKVELNDNSLYKQIISGCDKIKTINTKILVLILFLGLTITTWSGYSYGSKISSGTGYIETNTGATDITVNNIHGTTNHYTFLKAYLSDNNGKPISNKEIIFKIDGDPHTYITVTSTTGHALIYYYIFQKQGVYMIQADFKGDENYSPGSGAGKLTIE